jgi:hypothetical protein
MKTLRITLLLALIAFQSLARDTTVVLDVNFDGTDEVIKLHHAGENEPFELTINNKTIKGEFVYAYDSDLRIVDLNRNDNLREVVVVGYGPSDQNECFFYQLIEDDIVQVAHLPSNFGFETNGHGTLTEIAWMGFWSARFEYKFDSKAKTLTFAEKEFYDVNQQAEVKEPFKLLSSNNDSSAVVAVLKRGTKITLVKADITPACGINTGYIEDMMCDWFLIQTSSGVKGWCRLKDFHEKVDGLIWAG